MIEQKMYCEFCGDVFYDKYWNGGYIDHYENFSRPALHESIGKSVDSAFERIVKDANNYYRSVSDIKKRLNCFMQWPDVSDEVKNGVRCKCEFLIDKIEKAQEKAEQIVSGMTMLERGYIIDAAKENCSRPRENDDGKLFDGFEEWEKEYNSSEHPFKPMIRFCDIKKIF